MKSRCFVNSPQRGLLTCRYCNAIRCLICNFYADPRWGVWNKEGNTSVVDLQGVKNEAQEAISRRSLRKHDGSDRLASLGGSPDG